jgi:hypothetical protein
MIRVIIELLYGETPQQRVDLEVPAEIPADELTKMLVAALNLPEPSDASCTWMLKDYRSGRIIYPDKTLSSPPSLLELGLLDGSVLALVPVERAQPPSTSRANPKAWLISQSGNRYPLFGDCIVLGRAFQDISKNAVDYVDLANEPLGNTVSRQHAELQWINNEYYLKPLPQARNAVIVNGQELIPSATITLHDHDVIQIGGVTLTFVKP